MPDPKLSGMAPCVRATVARPQRFWDGAFMQVEARTERWPDVAAERLTFSIMFGYDSFAGT